jgi:RHS repeat-associated protein
VTDPLGRVVEVSRDLAGRVLTQTLPGGRTVAFAYDPSGNVTSVTPPDRTSHTFGYNATDFTASYTPPPAPGTGQSKTDYTYDLDGALSELLFPDGGSIVPGYDAAGRLVSFVTSHGTTTFTYDTAGRIQAVDTGGEGRHYAHDGFLPTSETSTGLAPGNVSWTYDNDFRLASTSVNGSPVAYQYDADSLLTAAGSLSIARDPATGRVSQTTLGATSTAVGYNEFGEMAGVAASAGSTALYSYSLSRDNSGRITGKTETLLGSTSTYAYGYDASGRLETVTRDGLLVARYAYDQNGNRLSRTASGAIQAGTYDAQDRMVSYDGAAYGYRPNGELATKTAAGQTTAYDYDAFGSLRTVSLQDGRVLEYAVDGLNRRVGKKVNGVPVEGFLYEGQLRPVAWLDGNGQVYARFVYGLHVNVPEYMVVGSATYRFLTDHLGSPRLVVNASTGAVVQRIDYDEWGVVLADSNPGFQPFGFAGGLYDRDTGLVRFGARDYDPSVGRWTAKDSIGFEGGDSNLYAYCTNDPVNFIDSTGLDWTDWEEWEIPQWLVDGSAGFGSGLTFGLTDWINSQTGASSVVNKCSGAYAGGQIGGTVVLALIAPATNENILTNTFRNSFIRSKVFRWGVGPFKYDGVVAPRLHFHLFPAMEPHLPFQWRWWFARVF